MKHIFTLFNQSIKSIKKPLLLACALLAMSGNAWGATLYGKTAVGSGNGTAKVEVISSYGITLDTKSATSSSLVTASTNTVTGVSWAYCKFTATPATGYSFDAWYTNSGCSSGKKTDNPLSTSSYKSTWGSKTYTYYAKFTPHTYHIRFDKNGGSGSDMSTLDCMYDKNKTLTTNSFTRTGYTFNGWNTKSDGNGTSYADGATVRNLTSTDDATITLYAQWTPITYTVKFNGNGNSGGSTANQTFTYDVAQNLRANGFTRAYTVTYNPNGGSCATSPATATFTFGGWAESATGAKKYNNQQNVKNLKSTNDAELELFAVWNGSGVTLPVATKTGKVFEGWYDGDTYIGAKNASYEPTKNITLTAHWTDIAAPRYTWEGEESYLVGDAALNLNALVLSNNDEVAKTFELVSFTPSGINNTGATAPTLTGSTLTLGQAGEVKVKVSQAATEYFYAGEETITITINKHANTIFVKGEENYRKAIEVDSYDNEFTFTATNTDYANNPIQVEQIEGSNVATYYPDQRAVYSAKISGEAAWRVTQAENYYYESATTAFYIDVRLAAEETCYILENQSQEKGACYGAMTHEHTWDEENVAGVVSFQVNHFPLSIDPGYKVQQFLNGEWKDVTGKRNDISTSYAWKSFKLNPAAKGVRFMGSGSLNAHFKDVSVTRYTYLNLSEESMTFDKTSANQPIYPGETSVAKKFTINWSMPNNGTEIQITSSNPDFQVSPSVINNTTCNSGTTEVTVTYSSECAEVDEGVIRVGNQVFLKEIAVTGTTINRDQAITWNPAKTTILTTDELVLSATASSDLNVAYSVVSGSDVATVDENTGEVTILKSGDVTFRVSQAGDCRYNAAENVDTLFHIDLTPATLTYNNGSVVVSDATSTFVTDLSSLIASRSDEGTITYEVISSNAGKSTIDGANFSATEIGDYTIRATKAETNFYTATTAEFKVIVNEGVIFNGDNGIWGQDDNWSTDAEPTATDRVIINADVNVTGDVEVLALTINENKTVTVKDGGVLTIGNGNSLTRETYGNIIVENGGELHLNNGQVKVSDFTLHAAAGDIDHPAKSGQVTNEGSLKLQNKAYFILELDPRGATDYGWYDFTVPFHVDAMTGIKCLDANEQWATITNEVNYAIMSYFEEQRAQGKYPWKKFRGVLEPGKGYTITVDGASNVYRFEMKAGTSFTNNETLSLQATEGYETRGWNAAGNGTMKHVKITDNSQKVQMYDHVNNSYDLVSAADHKFVVGSAYLLQTSVTKTLTLVAADDNDGRALRAPEREVSDEDKTELTVVLRSNGKLADRMIVTCSDYATSEYVIGEDLSKLGTMTAARRGRMWTNAKGYNLCAIHTAYNANEAIIPLQLFAPQAGEYAISLEQSNASDVYVLRDGVIVWNVAMGEYTFDLEAGTDASYSLRVVRPVEKTATAIDELSDETTRGTNFVEKMIVNGQLYILRDGVLYDAQGKKVATR